MRYAIYGLLVLVGVVGVLFGLSMLGDPRTEAQGILFTLIGVVAVSGLAVVMAIEHMSMQVREEIRRQGKRE